MYQVDFIELHNLRTNYGSHYNVLKINDLPGLNNIHVLHQIQSAVQMGIDVCNRCTQMKLFDVAMKPQNI